MTLTEIKAMFKPGDVWDCLYHSDRQPRAKQSKTSPFRYRSVLSVRSNEIVWLQANNNPIYYTLAKQSEILEARPGYLSMSYTHWENQSHITYRKLEGAEAKQIKKFLKLKRRQAIARANAIEEKLQQEKAAERLIQEEKEAAELRIIEDAIIENKTVTAEQLLIALKANGIKIPPQTIGAIRRKLVDVNAKVFRYYPPYRPTKNHPRKLYKDLQFQLQFPDYTAEDAAAFKSLQPQNHPSTT